MTASEISHPNNGAQQNLNGPSWLSRPYHRQPYFANCDKAEWEKYLEWLNGRRVLRENMSPTLIWTASQCITPAKQQRKRNEIPVEQSSSDVLPKNGWETAAPPGKAGIELEKELLERQEKFEKHEQKRLQKKKAKQKNQRQSSSESETSSDSSASSQRRKKSRHSKKRSKHTASRRKLKSNSSPSSLSEQESSPAPSDPELDEVLDQIKSQDVTEVTANTTITVTESNANATAAESDEDTDIGPRPLDATQKLSQQAVDYGGALRPGEGEAMAQFVQAGKRIPRRGEVGLTADQIEDFETLGYVMSGSRHRRMNAVRIRKENQVYSAEEQRALAMYNFEERANRETQLISDLREMLKKQNEVIFAESISEKLSAKL